MDLKDVNEKLQVVGGLDPERIEVYRIRRKQSLRRHDDDMGFLRATVYPDGRVIVTEMHIDPDKSEEVKALFAGTDVKVEEMPWA